MLVARYVVTIYKLHVKTVIKPFVVAVLIEIQEKSVVSGSHAVESRKRSRRKIRSSTFIYDFVMYRNRG